MAWILNKKKWPSVQMKYKDGHMMIEVSTVMSDNEIHNPNSIDSNSTTSQVPHFETVNVPHFVTASHFDERFIWRPK